MSDRESLIEQANELGLEFQSNIPTTKLQAKVDEAKGVVAFPVPKPAANAKPLTKRQKIGKRKKEALRTRVVTITNKDPRDNGETTTCHLGFENAYFGMAKNVPLDVPLELEVALIQIAVSATMTLHKKEFRNGVPTGNVIPTTVKRYAVSYEDQS